MDVKATLNTAVDASSLGKVEGLERKGKFAKDAAKIRKLSTEFEAMFLEQMLKGMRSSVQKSGFIDGGNAEEIYTSMLDTEYAKNMAQQRSLGLADMVERQLLESMGVKSDISTARPTLQEGAKTVTMKASTLPAQTLKPVR